MGAAAAVLTKMSESKDVKMEDAEKEETKGKKGLDDAVSSKKKEDFGPLLAAAIPQNRDLALKEGKKEQALENLLGVGFLIQTTNCTVSEEYARGSIQRSFMTSCVDSCHSQYLLLSIVISHGGLAASALYGHSWSRECKIPSQESILLKIQNYQGNGNVCYGGAESAIFSLRALHDSFFLGFVESVTCSMHACRTIAA